MACPRRIRWFAAGLALMGGLLSQPLPVLVTDAHAQTVFAAEGLLQLIPPGEIMGDGLTPVDLYLLAVKADGSPMAGLTYRATPTGGTCGALAEVGPGQYKFSFLPPAVTTSRQVEISLKGKALPTVMGTVYVVPPPSHRISIEANPPSLVLGQDSSSTITLRLDSEPGESLSNVELAVHANAGEVQNITPLGNGQYTALYIPPRVNYPHVAILSAVDRRDPTRSYGTASIPLVGKTNFPISNVSPGSKVVLRVGDRDFGPMPADGYGKATIPIMVPPGAQQATVIIAAGTGETQQRTEDLKVPDAKRLTLFPLHAGVPADARVKIPVRVAVVKRDGTPATGAQVSISASEGTVTQPVHEGNGVYRVDYTPPTSAVAKDVSIAASLASEPLIQIDTATIKLIPVRPTGVTLTAEPSKLPVGATGFKLLVQAAGPEGLALSGRKLHVVANGAKMRGEVKDLRGGDYQAMFDTTGTGPVEVTATVQTSATGNPLRGLVVVPMMERVNNDGLSSVMLNVVAVDEFGYPVADVALDLSLASGDGSLPASAVTNEAGLAQVYYTAGRSAGLVNIRVSAGDRRASAALLQAPLEVAPHISALPQSGTELNRSQRAAWAAIVKNLRVEREGALGVVAPVPGSSITGKAGPPAALKVSANPATVAAGGSVVLKVKLSDAEGRGVGGESLDILPSAGMLSGITELGNGEYQTTLTVPAGVSGEVKISAIAGDGAVMGFLKIPVASGSTWGALDVVQPEPTPEPEVPAWGALDPVVPVVVQQPEPVVVQQPEPVVVAPAVVQPEPVAVEPKPVKVKQEREPGEHPWIWGRAAIGSAGYKYAYNVFSSPLYLGADGDPLPYEESLEISGDAGAIDGSADPSPMSVPTIDLRAEGWLPFFPYVGIDVRYRTTWWAVETDSWTQYHEGADLSWADHFLTFQVRGRYFLDVGENRYALGVGGGTVTNSVPLVTYWTRDGVRGLWFFPWGFTSLYGSVQASAEFGFGLDVRLAGGMGTEGYSGVFARDFDLSASYTVVDHVVVHAGYNLLKRHIVVPQNSSADVIESMVEAEDARSGFYLGVGTEF